MFNAASAANNQTNNTIMVNNTSTSNITVNQTNSTIANNNQDPKDINTGYSSNSIQDVINHANPGDTIQIESGTYKEILNIKKNIILIGADEYNTIIDGQGKDSTVNILDCNFVSISDLTIINGKTSDLGGGIWNKNVNVTLTNVQIMNNTAGNNGGGIYNGGILTIYNSTISNNKGHDGAGIYNDNILNMYNCTINNNTAANGGNNHAGYNGGGIYNKGTLLLNNCTVYNNKAGNGHDADFTHHSGNGGNAGGIYNEGNSTLLNSLIYNNSAGNGGAATDIHHAGSGGCGGGIYNTNNLTIQNCQVFNNNGGVGGDATNAYNDASSFGNGGEGGYGGGIYNEGYLTITDNSTITNNKAGLGGYGCYKHGSGGNGGKGGGIFNEKNCTIINSNLTSNSGGDGSSSNSSKYSVVNGGNGGDGGAIYNEGALNLQECTINNNNGGAGKSGKSKAYSSNAGGNGGKGGNGGAIYNTKTVNITNCNITGNKAGDAGNGGSDENEGYPGGDGGLGGSGGAIYNTGTINITGSSLNQNSAGKGGNGGLGSESYADPDGWGDVIVLNPGNGGNGGSGGAIYNSGSIKSIINCNINDNNAGVGGDGGLYADDSPTWFYKNANPAFPGIGGSGGAIYSTGNLTIIRNTTINYNKAGNGGNGNGVSRSKSENGNSGGNGGGLVIYQNIEIINCQIIDNQAGNGGIGGNTNVQTIGDDSYETPSNAPGIGGNAGSGGGIYYYYQNNNLVITIKILNCTMNNNSAGNGGNGGIDDYSNSIPSNGGNGGNGGDVAIISSKIANPASYGLHLFIEESTITNNKAGYGGIPYLTGVKGKDGVGGGLYSNDNHYFTVYFNRILNNTPSAVYLNLSVANTVFNGFWNNWWGSNSEPKNQITGSNILSDYYNPWLILTINATPNTLNKYQISNVTANLIMNNMGQNTRNIFGEWVPNGISVVFEANIGTVNPTNNSTLRGVSKTIYTPPSSSGNATVFATVDNQTVSTPIFLQCANIIINKTVNNKQPNVGDNITYTITTLNNGQNNATGLQITDLLPNGFSNISYTTNIGTYNITTGLWNIGNLKVNTTAILKISGIVTGKLAGLNTTNNASITAINEYNLNKSTASATIYVPLINLNIIQHPWYYDTINKTFQKMSDYDNTIVYNINVDNQGPDTATNIIIKEVLGSGYTFIGCSSEGVGITSYDNISKTIFWNINSLNKHANAELSIFALVSGTGNNTPSLTVNASIYHVDEYNKGYYNSSNWSIYVAPSADVSVNQTLKTSNETDGEYVTYNITTKDNGPDNATNIQITDNLPVGLINPVITPSVGTYTLQGNKIVWSIPTLNNNDKAIMTIKAKINTTGTILNTASKTSQDDNDWNYNNNAQTSILTISGVYTPQVNMNIREYPWYYIAINNTYLQIAPYYTTFVYTVDVRNTGPTDATGVIVKEVLGTGYQYIACTPEGTGTLALNLGTITYNSQTKTITWNISSMPSGGMAWLSVFVLVVATGNNTPELTVNASLSHVNQYDIPGPRKWASYSINVPNPYNNTITASQLITAANTIKDYYQNNHNLPVQVNIAGQQISMPQLLQLLVTYTLNLNQVNTTTPLNITTVNIAPNPSGSYTSGNLYKTEYITISQNIINFINHNGRAPNYATTSLGEIPFNQLVYMYTKIIAFYGTNNRLPNYVSI